jgi:chromate transport protein ChrA
MGTTAKKSKEEYEELGRRLENIYLTGYINRKEMLKWSFIKGIVTGFGGVLGATILIGLLLWILSLFDNIPLVGPVFDGLKDAVQTKPSK